MTPLPLNSKEKVYGSMLTTAWAEPGRVSYLGHLGWLWTRHIRYLVQRRGRQCRANPRYADLALLRDDDPS